MRWTIINLGDRGISLVEAAVIFPILLITTLVIAGYSIYSYQVGIAQHVMLMVMERAEGNEKLWVPNPYPGEGSNETKYREGLSDLRKSADSLIGTKRFTPVYDYPGAGISQFAFLPPGFCAYFRDSDELYCNDTFVCPETSEMVAIMQQDSEKQEFIFCDIQSGQDVFVPRSLLANYLNPLPKRYVQGSCSRYPQCDSGNEQRICPLAKASQCEPRGTRKYLKLVNDYPTEVVVEFNSNVPLVPLKILKVKQLGAPKTVTAQGCIYSFQWEYTPWGECQGTPTCAASTGTQYRQALCMRVQNECGQPKIQVDPIFCDPTTKAPVTQSCPIAALPPGQWQAGSWSSCSPSCGNGEKRLPYTCVLSPAGCGCIPPTHADDVMACNNGPCITYQCIDSACPAGQTGRVSSCHRFEDGVDVGAGSNCSPACSSTCTTYQCVNSACPAGQTGTLSTCHRFVNGVDAGTGNNCSPACGGTCTAFQCVTSACPSGQTGSLSSCHRFVNGVDVGTGNNCSPTCSSTCVSTECLYRVQYKVMRGGMNIDIPSGAPSEVERCAYDRHSGTSCRWLLSEPVKECTSAGCSVLNDQPFGNYGDCNKCTNCSPGMCYSLAGGGLTYDCLGTLLGCTANQLGQCYFSYLDIPVSQYSFSDTMSCVNAFVRRGYSSDEGWSKCMYMSYDYSTSAYVSTEYYFVLYAEAEARARANCCNLEKTWGYYTYNPSTRKCTNYTGDTSNARICDITVVGGPGTPISLLLNKKQLEDITPTSVNFPLVRHPLHKTVDWYASADSPLLVYDPQHKKQITSAEQLFGNLAFGGVNKGKGKNKEWRDGYEALASLDTNKDEVLAGKELEPLGLWFDRDRDGVSQEGEVQTLAEAGISKLYFNGTRIDEKERHIFADRGYERKLSDGTTEIGASVDWRVAQYEKVGGKSSQSWRTSLLGQGDKLTMPSPRALDSSYLQGAPIRASDISGNWEFTIQDWPTTDGSEARGKLVFDVQESSGLVQGLTEYQVGLYNPEGQLVFQSVLATFKGKIISADKQRGSRLEFRVYNENGPETLSVATLSSSKDEMIGTSRMRQRSKNGQDYSVDYDWTARRLNKK